MCSQLSWHLMRNLPHHYCPEANLVIRNNAVLVVLIHPCRIWPWTWLKTYVWRSTLNILNWAKLDLRSTSACLYLHQLLHHKTIKIILSYLNSVILISCKYLVFRCRYHFINTILTDQCMHTPTFTKFYFKNVYFQKISTKIPAKICTKIPTIFQNKDQISIF